MDIDLDVLDLLPVVEGTAGLCKKSCFASCTYTCRTTEKPS